MKQNSLSSNKGLSLSQATSISNLCNQRATEIGNKLSNVNNFTKTVKIDKEEQIIVKGKKIPYDFVNLLKEKSTLHACQAFLMENIKAKDILIKSARTEHPDVDSVKRPSAPMYEVPTNLPQVNEEWGWEQLTVSEINEYLEVESFASHIGKFIHKGSVLDSLRTELPNIPDIEWMTIKDGEKSPVTIEVHHTPGELLNIHEELAGLHRGYEQRVNYYLAKVKNLVTLENARIAKSNADAQNEAEKRNNDVQNEYLTAEKIVSEKIKSIKAEFEKTRQANIGRITKMKIEIDPRFQETIDIFLKKLPESQE